MKLDKDEINQLKDVLDFVMCTYPTYTWQFEVTSNLVYLLYSGVNPMTRECEVDVILQVGEYVHSNSYSDRIISCHVEYRTTTLNEGCVKVSSLIEKLYEKDAETTYTTLEAMTEHLTSPNLIFELRNDRNELTDTWSDGIYLICQYGFNNNPCEMIYRKPREGVTPYQWEKYTHVPISENLRWAISDVTHGQIQESVTSMGGLRVLGVY